MTAPADPTPHEEMTQALKDCLAFLAAHPSLPGADELCDRLVRLTTPPPCRYDRCPPADRVVYSRESRRVVRACGDCTLAIMREARAEYEHWCPNCSCFIPIN